MFKKTFAGIAIAGAIAANYGVPALQDAATPAHLRMKVPHSQVLSDYSVEEIRDVRDAKGVLVGTTTEHTVFYRYKGDKVVPALPKENLSKRTEHTVTFDLGGRKHAAQSGYDFYRDGDVWKNVVTATTTKDVFDRKSTLLGEAVGVALAATAGPTSPSSATNDTTSPAGSIAWLSPSNVYTSDGSYASYSALCASAYSENSIKIIKGGSPTGTDKSTSATLPSTLQYVSYGGASDLWGTTWTYSDINSTGFGVGYSVTNGARTLAYLAATNFGFSIPTDATIDGIVAEVQVFNSPTGPCF